MALYAISDLHLSLSIDKPMDIFGVKWDNYMDKIKDNWLEEIRDEDYVLIPGDISWATYLGQAYKDFDYINGLSGIKIISKGNHDYWWTTANKLNIYLKEHNFNTIRFLHNNSILYQDIAICGARGWNSPDSDDFSAEDEKIYIRELHRLELSIQEGLKYNPQEIVVMLHYPPVYKSMDSGFVDVFKKYGIKKCIYGHLHGESQKNAFVGEHEGITFYLAACDYLNYKPLKLID
ncbi:metallophosphoesterase [Petroclostridium sp. X23]|uniref:metallophosphoesterase n=1 Tax=Petroclostridium sp. X23 TaxID=3045146 RepID=UPI0024ACEC9C|nr:metallophosphoesterase [Petroclostridium sp. X23]WHH60258.1 metallophosphoesterase [Petroclostridium sp. X23]